MRSHVWDSVIRHLVGSNRLFFSEIRQFSHKSQEPFATEASVWFEKIDLIQASSRELTGTFEMDRFAAGM